MTNQTQVVATNLNQVLIETIQQVKGGIGKGVDFAMEQVPDVCQQLLVWKFAEAVTYIICATLLIAAYAAFMWHHRKKDDWFDSTFFPEIVAVIGGLVLALLAPVVVINTQEALKIKLAPKVYLIEYAAKLVK